MNKNKRKKQFLDIIKKARLLNLGTLIAMTGILIALFTIIISITSFQKTSVTSIGAIEKIINRQKDMANTLRTATEHISKNILEIFSIQEQLIDIKKLPPETKIYAELSKLNREINLIKEMSSDINEIIQKNPEEALSLVLLKKDIDNFRTSINAELYVLRERSQTNFTLLLIILTGLVASILGILIRTLGKPRGSEREN